MTALFSLGEHSLYEKCQVNISHLLLCTNSSASLLALKFEISMSLARDISFLVSNIPSSGENKNDMIVLLSCWVYDLSCTCNLFSVPLIFAAVSIFASELHEALLHAAL